MAGLNEAPIVQKLAVPAVSLLILFLGYTSQWLFHASASLAPGALNSRQSLVFNTLLLCLWWTYYRACAVDPGRYVFPDNVTLPTNADGSPRWCKKCAAPKPPRAHHCRHCGRCIPKMDHHCPWTGNCVSMTTFPHFLRFLVYTNLSLWMLGYFLFLRFAALWDDRALPAYLGPSLGTLIHLTVLSLGCLFTSLALGILLVTTLRSWVFNLTLVEGWEQEKHEALIDRGGGVGWWTTVGPDGEPVNLEHVEFPYDISFFANMAQAMGTANFLLWFIPFAGSPRISRDGKGIGWTWEENGINDRDGMWPPPDPDRMRRAGGRSWPGSRRELDGELAVSYTSPEDRLAAFKARQATDLKRWQGQRTRLMAELEEVEDYDMIDEVYSRQGSHGQGSDAGWVNADGETLRDYGVDSDVDSDPGDNLVDAPVGVDEDEDVPLGDLLRRRNVPRRDSDED